MAIFPFWPLGAPSRGPVSLLRPEKEQRRADCCVYLLVETSRRLVSEPICCSELPQPSAFARTAAGATPSARGPFSTPHARSLFQGGRPEWQLFPRVSVAHQAEAGVPSFVVPFCLSLCHPGTVALSSLGPRPVKSDPGGWDGQL